MKCPTCDIDLERTEYEGESVFQCSTCTGYMADVQRMVAIKQSRQQSGEAEGQSWPRRDDSKPIRCPRCHTKMMVVHINEGTDVVEEILLDECHLCHAVWFDPGELALMQTDYERVQAEIERRKREAIARSIPEPEEDEVQSEANRPVDNARVMTDIFSLIGIVFAGALCYLFKLYEFDLYAGIAFAVLTFLAAWTAERFREESGGKQFMVAGLVTMLGLVLSYLIWIF